MDKLIERIKSQYKLDWEGTHGINHWRRVEANGMKIANTNGANVLVVRLFAYLHDARREDEWEDEGHGSRGAQFAAILRYAYFDLPERDFDCLYYAIEKHSDGLVSDSDVTVMTCWDADRLDLGRVGIMPNPKYLCTGEGRNIAREL
jgi:uncharacterized protein